MKIILARHCETDANADGRVQGELDPPLNAMGQSQADILGRKLIYYRDEICLLVTSVQKRAWQTTLAIHRHIPVVIRPEPGLVECRFGSLEGLKPDEFDRIAGPYNLGTHHDPTAYDLRPWGGESHMDVLTRALAALDDIRNFHDSETIVLVSHRRTLRTLLVALGYDRRVPDQGDYRIITV